MKVNWQRFLRWGVFLSCGIFLLVVGGFVVQFAFWKPDISFEIQKVEVKSLIGSQIKGSEFGVRVESSIENHGKPVYISGYSPKSLLGNIETLPTVKPEIMLMCGTGIVDVEIRGSGRVSSYDVFNEDLSGKKIRISTSVARRSKLIEWFYQLASKNLIPRKLDIWISNQLAKRKTVYSEWIDVSRRATLEAQ